MKKVLLALALFVAVASNTFAQRIEYGLKGGTNFTILTDANYKFQDVSFAPGFQAGGYALLKSRLLVAQAEIVYASNQWNTTEEGEQSGQTQIFKELKTKNGYISVPVMFYVPIKRLHIGIGPQINTLIKSVAQGKSLLKDLQSGNYSTLKELAYDYLNDKMGVEGGAYEDYSAQDPKEGSFYEKLGLGANFGLSLNLKRTRLEGRLNYGLTDVINDYYIKLSDPNAETNKEKLITGQVTLSIKL